MVAKFQHNTNATARKTKLKDKKIILLKPVRKTTAGGQRLEIYTPIHPEKVWAYYRHLMGDEIRLLERGPDMMEEVAQFIINYRSDYSKIEAVLYKDKLYKVTRLDDFEGYKKDITVYASTALFTGWSVEDFKDESEKG